MMLLNFQKCLFYHDVLQARQNNPLSVFFNLVTKKLISLVRDDICNDCYNHIVVTALEVVADQEVEHCAYVLNDLGSNPTGIWADNFSFLLKIKSNILGLNNIQ